MQKPIKNLLERSSILFAVFFSLLILVLSLVKVQSLPSMGDFEHSDKLKHALAYSVLSFFWLLSYHFGKIKVKKMHLLFLLIGYGVIIEVLQSSITSYRTGDLLDILANSIGVLFGYIFFKLLNRIYLQV